VLLSPDGIVGAAKYVRSRVRPSSLFERFAAQPESRSARSAVNE
jgi:hypothetical protein